MIIKSLSRKANPQQLLKYVLRYIANEKQQSKDKATIILKHNLRNTRSINGYIKAFADNESFRLYRRKDSVILYHDIISLHPLNKNNITSAMLKDIATQYIERRGTNNLYLIAQHSDKDHEHLHCVISGVQTNGYSSRISKQEFKSLKLHLERYQHEKYPELDASHIEHNKLQKKSKEQIIKSVKLLRQSHTQELLVFLEKQFEQVSSKETFINTLKERKYEPYFRNNILQGVTVEGRKFRFSRLGYSPEKIDSLEKKIIPEQNILNELQQLRKGKPKERLLEITPNIKEQFPLHTEEEKQLEELQKLRESNNEKERILEDNSNKDSGPEILHEENEPMQLGLFSLMQSNVLTNEE
jgi:hypothetical protein